MCVEQNRKYSIEMDCLYNPRNLQLVELTVFWSCKEVFFNITFVGITSFIIQAPTSVNASFSKLNAHGSVLQDHKVSRS